MKYIAFYKINETRNLCLFFVVVLYHRKAKIFIFVKLFILFFLLSNIILVSN